MTKYDPNFKALDGFRKSMQGVGHPRGREAATHFSFLGPPRGLTKVNKCNQTARLRRF